MLFNSVQFLVFFQIIVAAYFSVPWRSRWVLLLLASCYFYMVFIPQYVLILFVLIGIDYTAAIGIERAAGPRRTWLLTASLCANIGLLGFFKYFDFINANLAAVCSALHCPWPIRSLNILLPIGLSFHTFQAMSYTIEVYRGNQKAQRHLGKYALYVMFFPQLVAGPIERPQNLLHQFDENHPFDYQRVVDGLKRMVWGFIQKIVIADRLSVLVNHVYAHPASHNGCELLIATYFFAIQIYCDFSGYSDIAIGAARVLGINLMENFNRPYFSKSIPEFWRRWHISLSTWFRDYLYIPLGGNRVSMGRWYFNILFVFLISGLWHGANWTFLLWGAMHGAYLLASVTTRGLRERGARLIYLDRLPRFRKLFQVFLTFNLTAWAWIAFRSESVSQVWQIMKKITELGRWEMPRNLGMDSSELMISLIAIVLLVVVQLAQRRNPSVLKDKPRSIRWLGYAAAGLTIVFFGKFNAQSFIYFQF